MAFLAWSSLPFEKYCNDWVVCVSANKSGMFGSNRSRLAPVQSSLTPWRRLCVPDNPGRPAPSTAFSPGSGRSACSKGCGPNSTSKSHRPCTVKGWRPDCPRQTQTRFQSAPGLRRIAQMGRSPGQYGSSSGFAKKSPASHKPGRSASGLDRKGGRTILTNSLHSPINTRSSQRNPIVMTATGLTSPFPFRFLKHRCGRFVPARKYSGLFDQRTGSAGSPRQNRSGSDEIPALPGERGDGA